MSDDEKVPDRRRTSAGSLAPAVSHRLRRLLGAADPFSLSVCLLHPSPPQER